MYQILVDLKISNYANVIATLRNEHQQIPNQIIDGPPLLSYLKDEYGAKPQLIQFLSGRGGSGKSYVLKAFKDFVKAISIKCGFDETVFRTTRMTGASAANMDGGFTTHSV